MQIHAQAFRGWFPHRNSIRDVGLSWRRVVSTLICGLASSAAVQAATAPPASSSPIALAVGYVTINGVNPSPLSKIHIGEELSFQMYHRAFGSIGQIYPPSGNKPADMGLFARVGSTLFAPNFAQHGGTATGALGAYTPWTPVSTSALSGDGSLAAPYRYVVTCDAAATGLRLEMTITYANANDYVLHDLRFVNQSAAPITFDAYIGSDFFLANSDNGIPYRIASSVATGGQDCPSQVYSVLHIPITPADRYTAAGYASVWQQIGAGDLNNAVSTGCIDNGAALQWKGRTLQAGGSLVIKTATSFGAIPPIATAYVGVNKDLTNATGQTADGVEILIEGAYAATKSHYDGGFPSFQIVPAGSNTRLVWTGMNVPNGVLTHVGFEVWSPEARILGVFWTSAGNVIGCAPQSNVGTGTHPTGTAQIVYVNDVNACAVQLLYAGNLTVEYYTTPPALALLNPTSPRSPIAVDSIAHPPVALSPGGSVAVQIPTPPPAAQHALLIYTVSTDPQLQGPDATADFVLVTLESQSAPGPRSYCTGGTTTNDCVATISASANPSVSGASACSISVTNVEGQKSGILFYGLLPHGIAWAPSSTSMLCVKAPTQRVALLNSNGTSGECDGVLPLDWDAYQASHPSALGQPWAAGQHAFVQGWFRDPPAPKTTHLSNAVELTYQP